MSEPVSIVMRAAEADVEKLCSPEGWRFLSEGYHLGVAQALPSRRGARRCWSWTLRRDGIGRIASGRVSERHQAVGDMWPAFLAYLQALETT